jgi:hypothetical protein
MNRLRVFKNRWFAKFARKNSLRDDVLMAAALAIETGNFDADLGGHVYKQRVARRGQGKRGGYRTIVLLKQGERAFFVYGFAKNKLDNIKADEIADYKDLAAGYMSASDEQISKWVKDSALIEIV